MNRDIRKPYLDAWAKVLDPKETPDLRRFLRAFEIETTSGIPQPFLVNAIQHRIIQEIERQENSRRGYVRLLEVKPRQIGSSTLFAGRLLERCVRQGGQKCVIVAHDEDATVELYQSKIVHMWDQIPEAVRPEEKRSNRMELVLKHVRKRTGFRLLPGLGVRSYVRVMTAGKKRGLRSKTIQQLLLSEAALYDDDESVIGASLRSIHPVRGTSVVIESTANGAQGVFYRMCMAAKAGESEYSLLFFPWFDHPEYTRDFGSPDQHASFVASLTDEEAALMELYGLTLEQLNWYRFALANLCFSDKIQRQVDYPSSLEEAFISSGTCRFDKGALMTLEAAAPEPERKGRLLFFEGQWRFYNEPGGPVTIYCQPKRGREYVACADTAEGIGPNDPYEAKSDFSAACVYDRRSRKLMARVHARIDTDSYADLLFGLGMWYNRALLVVESNHRVGVAVTMRLRALEYPRLYVDRDTDSVQKRSRLRYGLFMDSRVREVAIAALSSNITHKRIELSVEQIRECRAFVTENGRRWEAAQGAHDDEVMAAAIFSFVNQEEPFLSEGDEIDDDGSVIAVPTQLGVATQALKEFEEQLAWNLENQERAWNPFLGNE
uniref:Putative terminase n=1 Tax=viral metagenome TaxID=1070528 RepID=A0A6H1ZXP8_9ZZZZ